MITIWQIIKNIIIWGLLLVALGWGIIWGFDQLATMGETGGPDETDTKPKSAEETMRPPSRHKSW